MPVLSRDREEDVPKCSGQEISQIFQGNFRFPGTAIWERRPLVLKLSISDVLVSQKGSNGDRKLTNTLSSSFLVSVPFPSKK